MAINPGLKFIFTTTAHSVKVALSAVRDGGPTASAGGAEIARMLGTSQRDPDLEAVVAALEAADKALSAAASKVG